MGSTPLPTGVCESSGTTISILHPRFVLPPETLDVDAAGERYGMQCLALFPIFLFDYGASLGHWPPTLPAMGFSSMSGTP